MAGLEFNLSSRGRICVAFLGALPSPQSARSALSSPPVVAPLGLAKLQAEGVWCTRRVIKSGPKCSRKGKATFKSGKRDGQLSNHGEALEPSECARFGSNVPSTGLAASALKV